MLFNTNENSDDIFKNESIDPKIHRLLNDHILKTTMLNIVRNFEDQHEITYNNTIRQRKTDVKNIDCYKDQMQQYLEIVFENFQSIFRTCYTTHTNLRNEYVYGDTDSDFDNNLVKSFDRESKHIEQLRMALNYIHKKFMNHINYIFKIVCDINNLYNELYVENGFTDSVNIELLRDFLKRFIRMHVSILTMPDFSSRYDVHPIISNDYDSVATINYYLNEVLFDSDYTKSMFVNILKNKNYEISYNEFGYLLNILFYNVRDNLNSNNKQLITKSYYKEVLGFSQSLHLGLKNFSLVNSQIFENLFNSLVYGFDYMEVDADLKTEHHNIKTLVNFCDDKNDPYGYHENNYSYNEMSLRKLLNSRAITRPHYSLEHNSYFDLVKRTIWPDMGESKLKMKVSFKPFDIDGTFSKYLFQYFMQHYTILRGVLSYEEIFETLSVAKNVINEKNVEITELEKTFHSMIDNQINKMFGHEIVEVYLFVFSKLLRFHNVNNQGITKIDGKPRALIYYSGSHIVTNLFRWYDEYLNEDVDDASEGIAATTGVYFPHVQEVINGLHYVHVEKNSKNGHQYNKNSFNNIAYFDNVDFYKIYSREEFSGIRRSLNKQKLTIQKTDE